MRVETIRIRHFRSISECELSNCGSFNVVIGKNNSGKSNILSAINAFFACISEGNVIALHPPFGKGIDFFKKEIDSPIEITITFELSLADRDALIRDIVNEAPQVKHAVDGLDPSLRLSVTVNIQSKPTFGFVRMIALISREQSTKDDFVQERRLMELNLSTAIEIQGGLSLVERQSKDIELLQSLQPDASRQIRFYFDRRKEDPDFKMSPNIIFDLLPNKFSSEISRDITREIQNSFQEASSIEEFFRSYENITTRLKESLARTKEESLKGRVFTFSGEESSIPAYINNLLSEVANLKVLYLKERRKPIGREEASKLLSLKITRGGPEVLRNIQETVSALLGVQIDAFESEPTRVVSRRGETDAEMDIDNFLADVNGSGIREALRIILDVQFEEPDILLIEEPEIYLHPSLEISMMRYLKRITPSCQVFISTHSTNFLDTGEMKNVYLVSKVESTQIQHLDYEEAESDIPRELGIRLSSLFMFDSLVFVEGPSDEDVIRDWASTLKVNLSQNNVGFIHMGGVRNFTHYAAETTLAFLTKRRVNMLFIIDKDEKDEAEIERLRELIGGSARVKVLERRELENYLVSSRTIAKFIQFKRQAANPHHSLEVPTEAEIREAIDKAAEELKGVAIAKRVARVLCRPIYPNRDNLFNEPYDETSVTSRILEELENMRERVQRCEGNVSRIYADQVTEVNNQWPTHKLSMVPGDLLLDHVCRQLGVRFKKEVDSARLASLMTESDIPNEIRQIVEEIGSGGGSR